MGDGIFIIFGATGDLAKRYFLPAFYRLAKAGQLSQDFRIIITTRRDTMPEDILNDIRRSVESGDEKLDNSILDYIRGILSIVHMQISDEKDYGKLKGAVEEARADIGKPVNLLSYLSVPPEMFSTIVAGLGKTGLNRFDGAESRLLIEKPFGYDAATAKTLIADMGKYFPEESIYRVDHYLAKETAQNILTFRLQNPLFRAIWNNTAVRHIMITASESIDLEGRSNFYEKTGALRDLIQSHLLQLLALVTMEEPAKPTSEAIHASKQTLLESIIPIEDVAASTVRGQYEGYGEDAGNPGSLTETYAAVKLEIDNDRWRGVPMLLRTGKAMAEKVTEITLIFKSRDYASDDTNALTIRIQPDEGIVLSLLAKKPSFDAETEQVQMEFFFHNTFGEKHADAYEKVLVDAIRGDKTLFTTDEEVMASWQIVEKVLKEWRTGKPIPYKKGGWGPEDADRLAADSNAAWLTGHLKIRHKQ